ncbi:hypothetical protein LTS10_010619 [Elasticomyces elasticus]|nr:hypothetical protein LTS10_010619 [Elasticomyces elasticus]
MLGTGRLQVLDYDQSILTSASPHVTFRRRSRLKRANNKAHEESVGENKASSWLCDSKLVNDHWLEVPTDLIIAASPTVTVGQACENSAAF